MHETLATALKRSAPPIRLEAPRVELRRHEIAFARRMFEHFDRDRARLREFLPWVDESPTWEDTAAYIQTSLEKWDGREMFDFGLFRREDGAYLGNLGAHSISWDHRRCGIGYWILGEHEGRGYVSEALRALEDALFGLGFNRIEIHCSSANARSASVPRRNGFVLEGVLRQDLIEQGRYRDTMVFAKLRSDAQSRSSIQS